MRSRWIPEWAEFTVADVVEAVREDYLPEMPPVNAGKFLLSCFLEVGPTEHTGMGEVRLSFKELQAYQETLGFRLQPWEVRTLRRLSQDYLYAKEQAEKPECSPPFVAEVDEADLRIVGESLKQAMRQLAGL